METERGAGTLSVEMTARVFAAAFCSTKTKEAFPVPPSDGAALLTEMIFALHGRAKYLTDGKLHVYPVKFGPVFEGIRLGKMTGAQFLFLAGMCMTLGIAFGSGEIVDPPAETELNAARRCMDRAGDIRPTPAGGLCCGMAGCSPSYTVRPDAPEPFVAGMLIGATLGMADTDFIFDRCEPTPQYAFCLDAITAYGGTVLPLAEGVRVCTRRSELPELPEKLRKKHEFFMPRGRV